MAPFTASRYVIPSEFLCSERKLCIWDILRFQWQRLSSHDSIRHRNGTSRSHTSNIAPEWFAKRLPRGVGELNSRPHSWIFTFVSVDSSLRSYLYTSGTVHTCTVRFIPVHTVLTKVRPRTYPISDAPFSRSARHSFAPLQKSRLNHRSFVWKEALSGVVFILVQKLHVIVWPLEGNDMPAKHFVFHG